MKLYKICIALISSFEFNKSCFFFPYVCCAVYKIFKVCKVSASTSMFLSQFLYGFPICFPRGKTLQNKVQSGKKEFTQETYLKRKNLPHREQIISFKSKPSI